MRRLALAFLLMFTLSAPASADPTRGQKEAAEALLEATDMAKVLNDAIDIALQAQLNANPALKPYEGTMREFLGKYMGWEALRPDMVNLYAEAFTEAELNEITAFYKTPTGKKAASSMASLMAKGSALGQQKVAEHQAELIEMVQKRTMELQQHPQ